MNRLLRRRTMVSSPPNSLCRPVTTTPPPGPPVSSLSKVLNELYKLYRGSKLLAVNTKKMRAIQRSGSEMSRTERRFVEQTKSDLKVILPFLIFAAAPFTFLVLPFVIVLFPSFLPSTFWDGSQYEKRVQAQETLRGQILRALYGAHGYDFNRIGFWTAFSPSRLQQQDIIIIPSSTTTASSPFLLETLHRPALVLLLRYFGVGTFISTFFQPVSVLADTLRNHFSLVARDDEVLSKVDGLTTFLERDDLIDTCFERGIPIEHSALRTWLEQRRFLRSDEERILFALNSLRSHLSSQIPLPPLSSSPLK